MSAGGIIVAMRTWPRPLSPEIRRHRMREWQWRASGFAMQVLRTAAAIRRAREDAASQASLSLLGWSALEVLNRAGCSPTLTDLARKIGISRQGARLLARELERAATCWRSWLISNVHGLELADFEQAATVLARFRQNQL
jgi:hypothetical protein